MILTSFSYKYPDVADIETRMIEITSDDRKVPRWIYAINELYCTDPKCDCAKVSLNVMWPNEEIYYFNYWFENPNFYMNWWVWDMDLAEEMSWLTINDFEWEPSQSALFMEIMEYVLNDKKYIDRLKKHYKMMKESVSLFEDTFTNDEIVFFDDLNPFIDIESSSVSKKVKLKNKKKKKLANKQKKLARKKKK